MNEITIDKYLLPQEEAELRLGIKLSRKDHPRDSALLEVMLATGARCSEILKLTVDDLNEEHTSIYLRATKRSKDREIPIPKELFQGLVKLSPPNRTRIFPFSYDNLWLIWQKYRPAKKGLHSLRHTFAINLYKRKRDIKLVQLALGHRSLMNTQIYLDFVYSQEQLLKMNQGA